MKRIETFNENNFKEICDQLAKQDPDLQLILDTHQPLKNDTILQEKPNSTTSLRYHNYWLRHW